MSVITSNLYVYVSAFLHCYCITKAFNFPISELCRCWGSDREEGEDCPFCCGNEKRLRQAGKQAGRLDRGWADDSILYRSTPDRLHQIHRWWSSPRCRVIILLPPFRTSTARHMFWKSLIVNQSTWTVFFGFVWVCVCVSLAWAARFLFFVNTERSDRGGLCFPGKANKSGLIMLRRS